MILTDLIILMMYVVSLVEMANIANINIDKCRHNQWLVRHHILFNCDYQKASGVVTKQELKPIACDPENGLAVTRNLGRPVFIGQEYKGNDGFVYECREDDDGFVTFAAKECYIENERFLPGHYVKGKYNNIYLCYKELDQILRIRMFRPAHNKCNSNKENDPNCKLGIIQTIMNSKYGTANSFIFNARTKLPISRPQLRASNKPKAAVLDLRVERPSLSPQELLQSIQGKKLPQDIHKLSSSPTIADSQINVTNNPPKP